MDPTRKPRVLFVYYTYTQQTLKVVEAMANVLRDRGCEVQQAGIEFTEPRYAERFSRVPLRHAYLDVFRMLPAQLRRATGEIRIPDKVRDGEYDLIIIGSFLKSDAAGPLIDQKRFAAFVHCRRYWRNNLKTVRKLGTRAGGTYADGIHFVYEGGQLRSFLSLVSYLGTGENRERYLGIRIPPTNIQPYHLEAARTFANGLSDRLSDAREHADRNGLDEGVTLGPLVNAEGRDKVVHLVADAVKKGAKVLTGGRKPDGPGFFYPATVLKDVPATPAYRRPG